MHSSEVLVINEYVLNASRTVAPFVVIFFVGDSHPTFLRRFKDISDLGNTRWVKCMNFHQQLVNVENLFFNVVKNSRKRFQFATFTINFQDIDSSLLVTQPAHKRPQAGCFELLLLNADGLVFGT